MIETKHQKDRINEKTNKCDYYHYSWDQCDLMV
jgi:hypothetical protein